MDYKLIVFDCESNGLHGEIFAIAAIGFPVGEHESVFSITDFTGRAPITGQTDQWVQDNVLPFLSGVDVFPDTRTMRDAFWKWLQDNKQDAVIVADFGVPVEANLLAACQKDDPSRTWDHPYPLHELGTLLLAAGVDPDIDRIKYASPIAHPGASRMWKRHNPLDDCYIAAHCWLRAWNSIQTLKAERKQALDMMDNAGVWTGADDHLLDRLHQALTELRGRPPVKP